MTITISIIAISIISIIIIIISRPRLARPQASKQRVTLTPAEAARPRSCGRVPNNSSDDNNDDDNTNDNDNGNDNDNMSTVIIPYSSGRAPKLSKGLCQSSDNKHSTSELLQNFCRGSPTVFMCFFLPAFPEKGNRKWVTRKSLPLSQLK